MGALAEDYLGMKRFSVFGVPIDSLTEDELLARLLGDRGLVVTPNPEILLAARSNLLYRDVLQTSVLAIPDGIAVRFAVSALDGSIGLPRHTGVDVLPLLASVAVRNNETLVLLGGFADDLAKIHDRFIAQYPKLRCVTIDPGFIDASSPILAEGIIAQIAALGPAIVAVGLGQGRGKSQGKQERVARQILDAASNIRIAIGVGGAFDMLAGRSARSPEVFRRFGFEWLWRLLREPWRFRRIVRATIIFPMVVIYYTIRGRRFVAALIAVAKNLRQFFFKHV